MNFKGEFLIRFTEELVLNSAVPYVSQKIENKEQNKTDNKFNIRLKEFNEDITIPVPGDATGKTGITESSGMEKIKRFLDDSLITEVECPGPGKFLLIHMGLNTKSTEILLDKSEVESVLNYFSKKSCIPRTGGIFKVIINNLVINAIDSDFGGKRFIITKIHPRKSKYLVN